MHSQREDIAKCEWEVLDWLLPKPTQLFWIDVPAPYPKHLRGFANQKVARFILPIRWAQEFDADPERCVILKSKMMLTDPLGFYC